MSIELPMIINEFLETVELVIDKGIPDNAEIKINTYLLKGVDFHKYLI